MDLAYLLVCAAIGIVAGVLGGLLGVGGGIVMVPAFTRFLGMPVHQAVATSITVIVFSAISASIRHHQQGSTQWKVVGLVVITSTVGAWVGADLSDQVPERALRLAFAAFLMIVSVDMAVRSWRM